MSRSKLILHVGMQQSGATMLQRGLTRIRRQLRASGFGFISHARLATATNLDGWMANSEPQIHLTTGFVDELAAMVEDELGKVRKVHQGQPTVLISSDQLLGVDNLGPADMTELRPRAVATIEQTIAALDPEQVTVVLFTQRQDRLMEFCYLREVTAGAYHHVERQFPGLMSPALDYLDLLRRIEGIAGVNRVAVRPYELYGAGSEIFVADFLETIGAPDTISTDECAGMASRHVYTLQGLQLARALNPHLDDADERRHVRNFLRANYSTKDESRCQLFAPDERLAILSAYASCNEELFRTRLPEFARDSYAHIDSVAEIAQSYLNRHTFAATQSFV